jgi:diguanylate cyclase (GGDEF)-like protein
MSEVSRSGSRRRRTERTRANSSSEPTSDLDTLAKEVLDSLIADNLPPTPNNFSVYFDKLREDKDENFRKQISSILELEENNDDENSIALEQSLKMGFASVKNILGVTANLYKNMALMTRILEKRKKELVEKKDAKKILGIVVVLEGDIRKLNNIVKKQSSSMKTTYNEIATIVKTVENETIFDNKFGVYNKRYLMSRIESEIELIKEFKHKSSLIMIELDKDLKVEVNNDKVVVLMTKTIATLLLKTSRRSDTVAHYGNGVFSMLLKHTDISSAVKASERLCSLVSSSHFFLSEKEIKLKISIGITEIILDIPIEEIILDGMNGIEEAYQNPEEDFAVSSNIESKLADK